MTENQTKLAGLQIEQSEKRERANALLSKDDRSLAMNRPNSTRLPSACKAIEPELRAALVLVQGEDVTSPRKKRTAMTVWTPKPANGWT